MVSASQLFFGKVCWTYNYAMCDEAIFLGKTM